MLCLWNEGQHCLVKSQLPKADQGFKARWQKANRSFDQKAETFDIKLLPGNSAASLHCLASNWILMTGHKRYSLPIPLSSIRGSHRTSIRNIHIPNISQYNWLVLKTSFTRDQHHSSLLYRHSYNRQWFASSWPRGMDGYWGTYKQIAQINI